MNNFAMPRPDLAYGGPGPILAVALQEQQASWAFYTSAVATHGNQAPLQTLLDSTAQLAHWELPLSFLSNGQSVPDDIIPATADRLAELLLRE